MIGKTISHYRITEKLGEGGMGVVYRAHDTSLNRDVAIKVLPESFVSDPERKARFAREARILATLSAPNIATIYGLEEVEGKPYLVLELVEGPTLADRIKKGRIPVDEALDICRQIAVGLEAAHEKAIVHRDLKPSNIKITPEGKVKILDFGLAKAFYEQPVATDPSQSPTITDEMTAPGVILGTAAYMSPEQARGKPTDKRTDGSGSGLGPKACSRLAPGWYHRWIHRWGCCRVFPDRVSAADAIPACSPLHCQDWRRPMA